jgi:hypothetical protein
LREELVAELLLALNRLAIDGNDRVVLLEAKPCGARPLLDAAYAELVAVNIERGAEILFAAAPTIDRRANPVADWPAPFAELIAAVFAGVEPVIANVRAIFSPVLSALARGVSHVAAILAPVLGAVTCAIELSLVGSRRLTVCARSRLRGARLILTALSRLGLSGLRLTGLRLTGLALVPAAALSRLTG